MSTKRGHAKIDVQSETLSKLLREKDIRQDYFSEIDLDPNAFLWNEGDMEPSPAFSLCKLLMKNAFCIGFSPMEELTCFGVYDDCDRVAAAAETIRKIFSLFAAWYRSSDDEDDECLRKEESCELIAAEVEECLKVSPYFVEPYEAEVDPYEIENVLADYESDDIEEYVRLSELVILMCRNKEQIDADICIDMEAWSVEKDFGGPYFSYGKLAVNKGNGTFVYFKCAENGCYGDDENPSPLYKWAKAHGYYDSLNETQRFQGGYAHCFYYNPPVHEMAKSYEDAKRLLIRDGSLIPQPPVLEDIPIRSCKERQSPELCRGCVRFEPEPDNNALSDLAAATEDEFEKREDCKKCCCTGVNFAVTGTLNMFVDIDVITRYIVSRSGCVSEKLSPETNYLINNKPDAESAINKEAKALGIEIITEDDFIDMFVTTPEDMEECMALLEAHFSQRQGTIKR